MAKYAPKVRIILDGVDITRHCFSLNVNHAPGQLDMAKVELYLAKIKEGEDGTPVYYLGDAPRGL